MDRIIHRILAEVGAPDLVEALGERLRIHTNNVLPTIRPVQVLADPTGAMALEAARRRLRQRLADPIHLCYGMRTAQ